MRPKLIAIFLLIVLAPLILLVWIGVRGVRHEQEVVQQRFQQLLMSKLDDARSRVQELVGMRERELLRATESLGLGTADLRRLVRHTPIASQAFLLDPAGKRLHPPPGGPLSSAEREFLLRAQQVWRDQHLFYQTSETAGPAPLQQRAAPQAPPAQSLKTAQAKPQPAHAASEPLRHRGWYAWYWGQGVNLLFWRRLDSGHVLGVELNRSRLMADIVARLPESAPDDPKLPRGRIRLLDSKGDVICQWGAYSPAEADTAKAALQLDHPLQAWRLAYFVADAGLDEAFGRQAMVSMVTGLGALGIALVVLAGYFYRESARELRDAAQRVTFVNQVSHELKTPLTNVRMYGELLQEHLADEHGKAAHYAQVVCSESQRLSRLIGNILTFARKQRQTLTLRPASGCVDDTIRDCLEHFRPALEAKGIEVTFSPDAPARVEFDADALEQILGNLVNNVEKYAADGGVMEVASSQDRDRTVVSVTDRGPGIPAGQRDSVFEPFHRLSDKLTEGVSGTGIGLSIARDLARLHGGDVRLMPSDAGASFEVTLRAPVEGA